MILSLGTSLPTSSLHVRRANGGSSEPVPPSSPDADSADCANSRKVVDREAALKRADWPGCSSNSCCPRTCLDASHQPIHNSDTMWLPCVAPARLRACTFEYGAIAARLSLATGAPVSDARVKDRASPSLCAVTANVPFLHDKAIGVRCHRTAITPATVNGLSKGSCALWLLIIPLLKGSVGQTFRRQRRYQLLRLLRSIVDANRAPGDIRHKFCFVFPSPSKESNAASKNT